LNNGQLTSLGVGGKGVVNLRCCSASLTV